MDITLILLLAFLLLFAAVLYYLVFIRKEQYLHLSTTGGIIFIVFILAPFLVIVLYYQFTASNRLQETGFTPHPDLGANVGIAAGLGENPTWIFSHKGKEESIINFYRTNRNSTGWVLIHNKPNKLVFIKENKKMKIMTDPENVIFILSKFNKEPNKIIQPTANTLAD